MNQKRVYSKIKVELDSLNDGEYFSLTEKASVYTRDYQKISDPGGQFIKILDTLVGKNYEFNRAILVYPEEKNPCKEINIINGNLIDGFIPYMKKDMSIEDMDLSTAFNMLLERIKKLEKEVEDAKKLPLWRL